MHLEDAAEQQERLKASGTGVVTITDEAYPAALREIYDPPAVLFLRGRMELLSTVKVALVGSRRPALRSGGLGEACPGPGGGGHHRHQRDGQGNDTAAHQGALAAGGATVAVFGCGLDIIYPAENRKLAERLSSEGLLVSEFPLGTPAHATFPIRNRIVSGLSEGVVVVEGMQYSGSLITARLALDQNKEVFAVPGNITNSLSFGPNLLIKQGARLVQTAADIVDGLSWDARTRLSGQQALPLPAPPESVACPMGRTGRADRAPADGQPSRCNWIRCWNNCWTAPPRR